MNQVLFDIANRLAKLEHQMGKNIDYSNFVYTAESAKKTSETNFDAILDLYKKLNELLENIGELNKRILMLESKR